MRKISIKELVIFSPKVGVVIDIPKTMIFIQSIKKSIAIMIHFLSLLHYTICKKITGW